MRSEPAAPFNNEAIPYRYVKAQGWQDKQGGEAWQKAGLCAISWCGLEAEPASPGQGGEVSREGHANQPQASLLTAHTFC